MAAPIIPESEIRIFMMDKPELNTLLAGTVRWTSEMINQAVVNVLDYFNVSSPPLSRGYTVEGFPSRYILLTGVSGYLLRSAAINQASNNFNYQAEGMTVQDHDKAQVFMEMGQAFWDEFKEMVKNLKIQMNIAGAYGTVNSEYSQWAR